MASREGYVFRGEVEETMKPTYTKMSIVSVHENLAAKSRQVACQQDEITAFHEAGHALMAILLGHPVRKISIGCAYEVHGYCQLHPFVNVKFRSHRETRIEHLVLVAMSGIAAEVLTFGKFDALGASDDMMQARRLVSSMNDD